MSTLALAVIKTGSAGTPPVSISGQPYKTINFQELLYFINLRLCKIMQLTVFRARKFHVIRLSSKIMLVMKLTFLLLTVALLQVQARGFAQQVTLSGKEMPMVRVFDAIKQQTGFVVVYTQELLAATRPVTLAVQQLPLTDFLQVALRDQPVSWEVRHKTIFLSRKALPVLPPAPTHLETFPAKGRVTDSTGQPLKGATVSIRGKSGTVVTDADGKFVIQAEKKDVLMIFYLGYETVKYNVEGEHEQELAFVLQPLKSSLNEVQVVSTGYQKIEKYQLTGAVSSIDQKDYDQRVAVTGNFLESLEGKIPGLVYNSQKNTLSIRGVATFDAVKQPLIVVDGFPTDIDLLTINPVDIVSVSVLRDAAAAAIYGVRASNGVIVIETRRGKSGKVVYNLRGTTAFQAAADFGYLKYANAGEFVQLQTDQYNVSNPSEASYLMYNAAENPALQIYFDRKAGRITPKEADNRLAKLGSYDNLSDYKRLFYRTSQVSNVNFDMSGGNDRNTFLLGMNYIGEKPVEQASNRHQLILNMANTLKLSKRISLDFRGMYANGQQQAGYIPPYKDFFPYERLTDENGKALPVALGPQRAGGINTAANGRLEAAGLYDQLYYPYKELTANTTTLKTSAFRFQGRLVTEITDWAKLELGGVYESQQGLMDSLATTDSYQLRWLLNTKVNKDPVTGGPLFVNIPQGDMLSRSSQKTTAYTLRAQLNLAKQFAQGQHDLSGMLGVEQRKTTVDAFKTAYFGYDGQSLINKPINLQSLESYYPPQFSDAGRSSYYFQSSNFYNQAYDDRRFMSFYAQGTYMYRQKYIATGSFRVDQSNLFGVDPKYKYKPLWSAGASWRLNKEDFLKDVSWLDELKLRAATGFNGNVPTSNNGPFLILGTALNEDLYISEPYNHVISPANKSLRWETTRNYNVGADYSFFHDRLSGSVDWYLKRSTDVFGQFDADPTSGFNQYNANTAAITNKGLEILISSLNVKQNKFEWRTQLTASFNHNEVTEVKVSEYDNSQYIVSGGINKKGYPMDALFSYNYGGLDNKGIPFVYDKQGNKRILNFYGANIVDVGFNDLVYSGTTTPKYVLGLNNQFSVGSFDFSFLFMYYGGYVMRVEQPDPTQQSSYSSAALQGASNYWHKEGDEAHTNIPGLPPPTTLSPYYFASYARYGYQYASQFVRRADYIRLRDVVVTYNAHFPFLQHMGLTRTQLRFQAQNVFRYTFSGNDIDPDAIDPLTGIRTLPQQPMYSFSLFTNF